MRQKILYLAHVHVTEPKEVLNIGFLSHSVFSFSVFIFKLKVLDLSWTMNLIKILLTRLPTIGSFSLL